MRATGTGLAAFLALCAASCAETLMVTGKVMDETGKPVAGAEVSMSVVNARDSRPVTTQSAPDGSFRLQFEGTRPQVLAVQALAPGFAVGQARYSSDQPGPVLVRLSPETAIRGRVLDQDGKPVTGAEVTLGMLTPPGPREHALDRAVLTESMTAFHCRSDAGGRFSFGHIPVGAEAELKVEAAGYAPWRRWDEEAPAAVGGAEGEYIIHLQPAAVIEGTVLHEGHPVPGVRVFVPQGITHWSDEATTDAEGRYRLGRLGDATYDVMVDPPPELVAPARRGVTPEPGKTLSGIDFVLTAGGLIEGRVIDAQTGKGVAGAQVISFGPARPGFSGARPVAVTTGPDGQHRIRVAAGRNIVGYRGGAPDYAWPEPGKLDLEVEVAEGQTVQAPDIELVPTPALEVAVVDPLGRPVAQARIRVVGPSVGVTAPLTGADGRSAVCGLGPGHSVLVVARDPTRKLYGATTVPANRGLEPVRVTVGPPATVECRFVDPAGQPLPGIGVSAWIQPPLEAGPPRSAATGAQATSGPEGLVRLEGLPGGARVAIGLDRETSNTVEWPDALELRAGETIDLGEIILDVATTAISGVVLMPDQTPVKGASVRVSYSNKVVRTDEQGRFRIEDLLPSKPVTVIAGSRGGKLWGAEEIMPDWGLEPGLVLTKPVRLVARLVGADGAPLAKWGVSVTSGLWGFALPADAATFTGEDGRVAINGLVVGLRYQLFVSRPGQPADEGTYERDVVPEAGVDCDVGDIVVQAR